MKGAWITDQGGGDITATLRVTRRLHEERTPYQYLEVYESPLFGRMLVLDGAVQTTEGDEFAYHEMLAHPALSTHPAPRRVLIIGGGDGGLLEEVLKHPVERVTMVEIDEAVVRVARQHLGTICRRAFDDPRTALVIGDGIAYIRKTEDRFDVVLVDSPDPQGPAAGLFAPEFYAHVARRLTPDGLVAVQSGSAVYQQDLIRTVRRHLGAAFPLVRTYLATVAAYPGGLWSFSLGSLGRDPLMADPAAIAKRIGEFGLRYFTASRHHAAFDLPPYLRDEVAAG